MKAVIQHWTASSLPTGKPEGTHLFHNGRMYFYTSNGWKRYLDQDDNTFLNNGRPAYLDTTGDLNTLVSFSLMDIMFNAVGGTRNNLLIINSGLLTAINSVTIAENAVLKHISAGIASNASSNAVCQVRKNGNTTPIGSATINSGTKHGLATNVNALISAGDYLSVYVDSSNNVTDPVVFVQLAWRN